MEEFDFRILLIFVVAIGYAMKDLVKKSQKKISSQEFLKSVITHTGSIIGGCSGIYIADASTTDVTYDRVGAVIGYVAGAMIARVIAGRFIEDDDDRIVKIMREELEHTTKEMTLSQQEIDNVIALIKEEVSRAVSCQDVWHKLSTSPNQADYISQFVRDKIAKVKEIAEQNA